MPVIVGVPRSGTTLLRIMLDAHSALAIPPETGFLPRLAALDGVAGDGRAASEAITGAETWPDLHLDATTFETEIARLVPCTPADVARTFYRMYASRFGKARWGDKTPTYGTEIDRIAGLLPEGTFSTSFAFEIVGVAANARYGPLKRDVPPLVYVPYAHVPSTQLGPMTYALRTDGNPLRHAATVRQIVHDADPRVPVNNLKTQAADIDQTINQE